MKQPELISTKSDSRCLVSYFDPDRNDYDEAVERVERQIGVVGEKISVVALPDRSSVKVVNFVNQMSTGE